MATKARARRVCTLAYLRTEVLDLTQEEIARILGRALKTAWSLEQSEVDMLTMDQLRLLYRYALETGIRWPASLTHRLLEREMDTLDIDEMNVRRARGPSH